MLQPDSVVDSSLTGVGLGGSRPGLAGRPDPRDDHAVRDHLLEVLRLPHDHPAGRPAGHPAGARGGGAASTAPTAASPSGYVTLPLLGPTLRVSVFLSIIGALQLFDMVWVMTGGGPVNASSTMAITMFKAGFRSNQFGYGSAAGGDPVPVLPRRRPAVPAVRPAAGHRRRHHGIRRMTRWPRLPPARRDGARAARRRALSA